MDRKQFNAWFKKFINNYGDYHPKNMDDWLDEIDNNHKRLREILGGISKTFEVECHIEERILDACTVRPIMDKIAKIIPTYYDTYGLYADNFCYEQLAAQKNLSATKHIMTFARRQKLSKEKERELNKCVAALGQLHRQNKLNPPKSFVTLSTDPRAFCLVGNYKASTGGLDNGCFGQGHHYNGDKKYAFGSYPDSMVILTHKAPEVKYDHDFGTAEQRALALVDENNSVYVTNIAGAGPNMPICPANLELVFGQLLKYKKIATAQRVGTMTGGICYSKPHGTKFVYVLYDKDKCNKGDLDKKIKISDKYSKECHPRGDSYGLWDNE